MDYLNLAFRKVADTTANAFKPKEYQAGVWAQQGSRIYRDIDTMERQYYHDEHFKYAEDCGDDVVTREHELDITHERYPFKEPERVVTVVPRTKDASPITSFSRPEEPARGRQTWDSFVARTPSPSRERFNPEDELRVRLKTIMADYTIPCDPLAPAGDEFYPLGEAEFIAAMHRPKVNLSRSQAEQAEADLELAMKDEILPPWKPWEDTRIYRGPRSQSPEFHRTEFTEAELDQRARVQHKIEATQERDLRSRRRIVGGYEDTIENARIDAYTGAFLPTLEGWDGTHEKRPAPVLNLPLLVDHGNWQKITKHREDYEFVQNARRQQLDSKLADIEKKKADRPKTRCSYSKYQNALAGRHREQAPVPTYSEALTRGNSNFGKKKNQSGTVQGVFDNRASKRLWSHHPARPSDASFVDDEAASQLGKDQTFTKHGSATGRSSNATIPRKPTRYSTKEYSGSSAEFEAVFERHKDNRTHFLNTPNKSPGQKDPAEGLISLIDYDKTLTYNGATTAMQNHSKWGPIGAQPRPGQVLNGINKVPGAMSRPPVGAVRPPNVTLFEWVNTKPREQALNNNVIVSEARTSSTANLNRQESDQTYFIYTEGLIVGGKTSAGHEDEAAPVALRTLDRKSPKTKPVPQVGTHRVSTHVAELAPKKKEERFDKYDSQANKKAEARAAPLSPAIWEQKQVRRQGSRRSGNTRGASSRSNMRDDTKKERSKKTVEKESKPTSRTANIVARTLEPQTKTRQPQVEIQSKKESKDEKGEKMDKGYVCKPAARCHRRNKSENSNSGASFHSVKASITPPSRRPVWPTYYTKAQPKTERREERLRTLS